MASRNLEYTRDLDLIRAQFEPKGKLPTKPKLSTAGKEVKLTLNTWPIVSFPQRPVWQYDILIGNGVEKRAKIDKVWKCPTVQSKLGRDWIFDGNRIAWSLTSLDREVRVVVDLDKEYGRTSRREVPDETTFIARKAKTVKFDQLTAYLEGRASFDNEILEAINFMDHLLRMWPSSVYTKIKRNFFSKPQKRVNLGDGVEAYHGVYQSIRPVHSLTGAQLSVNVDVANGTFWTTTLLHYTAREVARCRDLNELSTKLQPQIDSHGGRAESPAFKLLRMFRKIRVTVTHRGQAEGPPPEYVIEKFINMSAMEYKQPIRNPETGQQEEMTIHQYFLKKYNMPLTFPHYPLVKTTRKDNVIPMELCRISPNQRCPYKLNEQQTAQMIKFAVTPPDERWQHIYNGIEMLKWDQDPNLKAFDLKISQRPAEIKAHVLPNPKVQFANGSNNPGTSGRWDLRGKKFMAGNTKELQSWGIMVVEGRGSPDKAAIQRFVGEFIKIYTQHGGRVANPKPAIVPSGPNTDAGKMVETLWHRTGNESNSRPQMLMFVLLFKEASMYNRIKKSCDCRFGVVSQCMQSAHVLKCQGQYISNVCMKFNAKLGGFTSRAIGPRNDPKLGSFDKPTMIIGADVSHAAPGAKEIPSMASMTFSVNHLCTRYAAAVDTNGHRVEMITTSNIEKFMKPMITGWSSNLGQGRVPERIIYLRDGVSEGQYHHVRDQEISDMKAVIKSIDPRATTKITAIVATKRHHYRFFPHKNDRNASDRNGNPLPGTLVQTGITSPFEYDFYLCSHSAIKGTARPVAYHVILDENNFPPNELQQMIYEHSYQYIRSTTPVSIHPAVYYAHLASKRAVSHENKPSESGPQAKGKKKKESSETSSSKKEGEYLPLIPMPEQGGIKFEMWYV